MKDLLAEYRKGIIDCLTKYGGLTESSARELLDNSKLLSDVTKDDDMLFHEYPYFWAMNLLYSKTDPNWFQDPKLWPPPAEYFESLGKGK